MNANMKNMNTNTNNANRCCRKNYGKAGEDYAADYLAGNGFRILDRNYRPGKIGEIDIIAEENEYICFVEVKTRSGSLFGAPSEAVGHAKRRKLRTLAWAYMKNKNLGEKYVRFDIVEVTGSVINNNFVPTGINLIRSAF